MAEVKEFDWDSAWCSKKALYSDLDPNQLSHENPSESHRKLWISQWLKTQPDKRKSKSQFQLKLLNSLKSPPTRKNLKKNDLSLSIF